MDTNDNGWDFLEDSIREILLRSPVKSLLRFKCVCKNWYTLIKNPNFIREHLNFSKNNPPQLLIYDYGAPNDLPPLTFISDNGIDSPTHERNLDFNFGFKFLSFNFGNEVFEMIEGPPHDYAIRSCTADLIILDDSIAILNEVDLFVFYVWVMIQPGVWNKFAIFHCFSSVKSCCDSSLILATRRSRLISYNVKTKKTRHLEFRHPRLSRSLILSDCGVHCYKESLVTLKRQGNG
uniref:F-box family protein n=1 Tax=Solanum tuberosum TaxID=4113 RepID=M1AZM8_SOLTU